MSPRARMAWNAAPWLALAAAALLLRLAWLNAESVDLEEYACLARLDAPDLKTFLTRQRELYPYGAPLVPLLFHLWAKFFGTGAEAARALSMLAGMAVVFMMPPLARALRPDSPETARRAGWTAALLAALSPVHLFQANEARMYAFVALFAALSWWTLLRAVRGGGATWWIGHLLANAALVWSHYLAAFVWPAQALYLLAARGMTWRGRLAWCAAHALLCAPVALWIAGIAAQPDELHEYYTSPDWRYLVLNWFAGEGVNWTTSGWFPSAAALGWLPEAWRGTVRAIHPAADWALFAAFAGAFLWAALALARGFRGKPAAFAAPLLLWFVVPMAGIVMVSLLWKPLYASRYLVHTSLAAFLMLGFMLAGLNSAALRRLAASAMALLFCYQLCLSLPPQTRTAWRAARQLVSGRDGDAAPVMVQGVFWLPIFRFNLEGAGPANAAVQEPETMADTAALLLAEGGPEACWAVLVDVIHGQDGRLAEALKTRGLAVEQHRFPGERVLTACRITPEGGRAAPPTDGTGVLPVLEAFANTLAAAGSNAPLEEWSRRMRAHPDPDGGAHMRLGMELALRGRGRDAALLWRVAVRMYPANLVDLLILSRELGAPIPFDPMHETALAAAAENPELLPRLRLVLQGLWDIRDDGLLVRACNRAVEALPDWSEGYAYHGMLLLARDDFAGALPLLERAVALNPDQFTHVKHDLAKALLAAGRPAEAGAMADQALEKEPGNDSYLQTRATAFLDCNQPAEAARLLERELAAHPGNTSLRELMAEARLRLGEFGEAKKLYDALSAENPGNAQIRMMGAFALAGMGDDAALENQLRALCRDFPGADNAFISLVAAAYDRHDPAALEAAIQGFASNGGAFPGSQALMDALRRAAASK